MSAVRFWFSIVLALAVLWLAAGCAESPRPQESAPTPEGPRRGGTLRLILDADPNSLGYPPQILQPRDFLTASAALETLGRWNANGGIDSWLAREWRIDAQTKTMSLTLREGVKFQDGTDFNAEAVKWNIELMMSARRAEFANVTAIEVTGPYTLNVRLSEWDTAFHDTLLTRMYIISPTSYRDRDAAIANPVGTGPFKLVSWTRGVDIRFERSPSYWQEGKPYLDGLVFRIVQDPTTAAAVFQSGEADVFLFPPAEAIEAAPSWATVAKLATGIGAAEAGITFDSGDPRSPFADVRVRQAVAHAINRQALLQAIYKVFTATNQLGVAGAWSYNPNVRGYAYDPERARQLLAEAGYPNGFATTLTVTNTPQNRAMAAAVQSDLQRVGIRVEIQVVDAARYFQLTSPGGTGWSGIIQWSADASPNIDVGLTRAYAPGGLFPSRARPDEVLQVLRQARTATAQAERQRFAWDLQDLIFQKYVLDVPFGVNTHPMLKAPKVRDDRLNEVSLILWTPEDAWLAP